MTGSEWTKAQEQTMQWYATKPEYAERAWKLDTKFLDLETTYLKRLSSLLPPEKQKALKEASPNVYHYPFLK